MTGRMSGNFFTLILYIALTAAMGVGLTGCDHNRKYRIAVAQCSYDDWRAKLNSELEREMLVYPDAELIIESAEDSPERQNEIIREFIASGVDVIVVSPIDSVSVTDAIAEAREAGIPVVTFDRSIKRPIMTAHIGANNEVLGSAAADFILSRHDRDAVIIEICGLRGSTPASDRHRGFERTLHEGGARLAARGYADWSQERAREVADSLLRAYPDTRAVFAQNDRMALAVREAAEALGIDSLTIVGIDAVPGLGIQAVADGRLDATFIYPTSADVMLETAMQIARGEEFDTKTVITSVQHVDSTNAEMLLTLARAVDAETDKVNFLHSKINEYTTRQTEQRAFIIAVGVILLLLGGWAFMLLRAYWANRRHREQLSAQNAQLLAQRDELQNLNTRLEEATRSKLIFYTNASHDLRTPLTLIAEPVNQVAKAPNLTADQRTLMQLASKNVKILLRLINEILDFRKYENGKMDLNLQEVNLREAVEDWAAAFRPLAQKRHLHLTIDVRPGAETHLALDPEKMERVFFNLMSNAFRYTPDNGTITATVDADADSVTLRISDNGQGMTEAEVGRVFERFYRAENVRPQGSGIGLALVKSFVELHGGKIAVESVPGAGTTFTVTLPVKHVAEGAAPLSPNIDPESVIEELDEVAADTEAAAAATDGRTTVLVIDDNADIRTLVRTLLSPEYAVAEAAGGAQGIKLASKYIPDLVICDVMMPDMDGMECCSRLKGETVTSHIPVLMLTACNLDRQRAEGYASGADGYLAKPFDGDVFRARVDSLIANRRRIRSATDEPAAAKADRMPAAKPGHASGARPLDNEFYNRVAEIMEAEMGNADITVEEIGARVGLSRVQFYRKVKALTNFSPNELLRNMRLQAAYRMLTSTERTVSEVAYAVGFTSPGYFTKCFREAYGELPTELQKRTSKITDR